jgi:uncharacterized protein YbjQ (UPF0145 family)
VLSAAVYHARELALQRMEEEAASLGADGIVGVRLDVCGFGSRGHTAEFLAVGTAVRYRNGTRRRKRPFTSDLTGQDFWALLRTGSKPPGMVMGSCVDAVTVRGPGQRFAHAFRNVELPRDTRPCMTPASSRWPRMQQEASALAADGIVGVNLTAHGDGWGGQIIEFFAIGTAISRDPAVQRPPSPAPVIHLGR